MQDAKKLSRIRHLRTIAQLRRAIPSQLRHVSTIGKKNLLNSNISSTCPYNMNFGLLTAEICWWVSGTPANVNGFRVLTVLLHGTLVVGISQNSQRWIQGATYIRQGGHHAGQWPTFQFQSVLCLCWQSNMDYLSEQTQFACFLFCQVVQKH